MASLKHSGKQHTIVSVFKDHFYFSENGNAVVMTIVLPSQLVLTFTFAVLFVISFRIVLNTALKRKC